MRMLAQFLDNECLPFLAAKRADRMPLSESGTAAGIFRALRLSVAADSRPKVDLLERCCRERGWMDLQTKYQHWLHGWLLVHVPVSFLLLLMTLWHAFVTLFHY
jgi:hypothetical protein